MASANDLEAVRSTFDAFNRRDGDALLRMLDPEMEWHPLLGELGGGVYRGHEGALRLLSEVDVTWETLRIEIDGLIDAGERIFAFLRSCGRGRASGVDAEVRFVAVIQMRDGRMLRAWSHATLELALAAAGLERLPAAAVAPDGYAER